MRAWCVFFVCLTLHLTLLSLVARAQSSSTPPPSSTLRVAAVRVAEPITVDGKLSETVWQSPGLTGLRQSRPDEGFEPSQRSEIWVGYDEQAIYVAARLHDSAPDSIMLVLGRRDYDVTADWFAFYVDPYYDRRSGFFFALSAAGSMVDGTLYNDDWNDDSWDGVWEGKTRVDDQGWTAEMRIPFSQLRFHQQASYRWAVNFRRSIGRRSERDFLVYTPRNESGFVSRFVDLLGIENIQVSNQIEVLPYVNARVEYLQHLPGDPFNDGSKYLPGVGADFKIGLGSNLTLDATVNPDFGQVEVDPAVVNLSDVETYFQEKRPFFIEGANIFRFGYGGASSNWGFNWANPTMFYSRRIGRSPQGALPEYDFAEVPLGTHILGAGKLTGNVGNNWKIGTVHALTRREFADVEFSGRRSRVEVEPLTYYGVLRAQKEFNEGRQGFGVISTITARKFSDEILQDQFNGSALVAGVDGWTFLDSEKTYVASGWSAISRVQADHARMIALQHNSAHYFQRPDASHLGVDSSATSLTGFAGRISLNKQKGPMVLNAAFGIVDPRFDSNDLGFLSRTDILNGHIVTGYRWKEPTDYYRSVSLQVATFANFDFEGNKIWHGYFHNGSIEFLNFYFLSWGFAYNPFTISNRRTRGGPLTLNLPGREVFLNISTDSRKQWVIELAAQTYQRTDEPSFSIESEIEWKPRPNLTLSVGPSYSKDRTDAQWISEFDDPLALSTFGKRYLLAVLDQTTFAANIRLNWTLSPQLSLQLFLQPLISSADYHDFKELLRPNSYDFRKFGHDGSTLSEETSVAGEKTYRLDPDGSGAAPPIEVANPDFNFRSLRGNAVLRWEYRPGSVLYLVWTQGRSDSEALGDFQFDRSFRRLWSTRPDNIFMLKFTYWLAL